MWAPGELGGRTFLNQLSEVIVANPPGAPLWVPRGLVLGYLNLLLYPPLTASGAPFHSPVHPPGCPAGTNGSLPTEGFEEASGLGHIPHPASDQDSHSCGCKGLGAGWGGGHCCPFPLPASHWTYNSGTEPGSRCPPNPVSGETSASEPGTHAPTLERKEAGMWVFSGSVLSLPFSFSSSLLCPFTLLSLSIFLSI